MTVRDTCGGPVSILSNEKHHAVSYEGWTDSAGKQLCKDLGCGHFNYNSSSITVNSETLRKNYNCSAKQDPKTIWDCEINDIPGSSHKQLSIDCAGKSCL